MSSTGGKRKLGKVEEGGVGRANEVAIGHFDGDAIRSGLNVEAVAADG